MKRTAFIIFLILLFTACGSPSGTGNGEVDLASNESNEVAEAPTSAPAEEVAEEEEVEEAIIEETAEEVAEEEPETAVDVEPEPEQEVLQIDPVSPEFAAEIRENDWVKGAENGRVVIIEYGDFQ